MKIYWMSTALFGIGILILAFTLLSFLIEFVPNLFFLRRKEMLRFLRGTAKVDTVVKVAPEDVLGMANIPWMLIYILSLAVGIGLYAFTQQVVLALLSLTPFAVKVWLTNYRKRQLNAEVLDFLTDLRLAMPLQGSLLRSLQDVAERGGTRLAKITNRYLSGGFGGSGLELLDRLAKDTRVSYLSDLVAWTQASEECTMAADAPFEHALSRLQAEANTTARENLQKIPTRLTVLVLPALLGPSIVVLLYPVVARLLLNMGGTGWSGGF